MKYIKEFNKDYLEITFNDYRQYKKSKFTYQELKTIKLFILNLDRGYIEYHLTDDFIRYKLDNSSNRFIFVKGEDDYYLLNIRGKIDHYFICDQISGLKKCLKDKI